METITCGLLGDGNEYTLALNPAMSDTKEIIKIKEESNLIPCRCLLAPRCRAFEASVVTSDGDALMFKYKKEFGWPILMFCRPKFEVYDAQNRSIG